MNWGTQCFDPHLKSFSGISECLDDSVWMTVYNIRKSPGVGWKGASQELQYWKEVCRRISLSMVRRKCSYSSQVDLLETFLFCKAQLNLIVTWCYVFVNLSVHDIRNCHADSGIKSRGMDLRALSSRWFREQEEHSAVGRHGAVFPISRLYFIC